MFKPVTSEPVPYVLEADRRARERARQVLARRTLARATL